MNQKALRWEVTGPAKNGAAPVFMYQYLHNKQVKIVYSDGSFIRYACWPCAMKTKSVEIVSPAPTRVLVPPHF